MVTAVDLRSTVRKDLPVRVRLRAPQSNFPIFARPIRPREARKGMETLARRARRGSLTGTPKFRHIVNGLIACKTICLKQINMSLLTLKSRSWKG